LEPFDPAAGAVVAPPSPAEPERRVGSSSPFVLEYHSPAGSWEREALPIGNGSLGAMLMGSAEHAELVFNVGSLWTGGDNPSGVFDDMGFGAYQAFGRLQLELEGVAGARNYVRRLDLRSAVHERTFTTEDGTRYVEETFSSTPSGVIALRLRAEGSGALTGTVRLSGAHGETTTAPAPRRLGFDGRLPNGLDYSAVVAASGDGTLGIADGVLRFSGSRILTLLLTADTAFVLGKKQAPAGSPAPALLARLDRAESDGFERLRTRHVEDHARLFGRVDVDFGRSSDAVRGRTTDRRIEGYQPGGDPELLATLFHYGRYLLIASSRPGGLPANLQGIWNDSNSPPWHADYHSNINLQMNYWLAEPANLPECHLPLFDLLDATLEEARSATRASFGADVPGFTYRTSHNPFGGQGWEWNTPASAWYALHYFEHYAFGGDRDFLARRAWPYLREVSEFWLHRLKKRADGALVAPDGWSPEHGPREDGVTYDQELVWTLFSAALAAAEALGQNTPIVRRIADARSRLLGPKIGRWGQLMEWMEDRDDPDDHHRHTSHLVGVYPGHHISTARTPELAKAAEVSLRARSETGDSRRSWTWPWRCALWARLRTPDCHRMLDGYVAYNLLPNLIATHPPLQLDGSFGLTAGIAEMLLQSHAGEVDLLPGVDRSLWPSGSFRGLRARGGFELAVAWKDGRLASAELLSTRGGPVELRATPLPSRVDGEDGAAVPLRHTVRSTVSFGTKRGMRYRLRFE
jgi:alpha-L-fucosidase 2